MLKKLGLLILCFCSLVKNMVSMNLDSSLYCAIKSAQEELKRNFYALHDACKAGDLRKAQLLIAAGASVDAQDSHYETPLSWAARYDDQRMAELLIGHNASIDARNKNNWTPLHRAAWDNKQEMIELLISKKFFLPKNTRAICAYTKLKEQCLIVMLKSLPSRTVLKNSDFALEEWSADFIADHVPLNQQQELIQAWLDKKKTHQVQSLIAAHYKRHLLKLQQVLAIRDLWDREPRDMALSMNYQNMAAFLDSIAKASSFSALDPKLQQLIQQTIAKRLASSSEILHQLVTYYNA